MAQRKYTVFIDFDNTITKTDVIDDLLFRFSKNKEWVELEKRWKNGEIGSRKCLGGQIRNVLISRAELNHFLSDVKIDRYFKKLIAFLRKRNADIVIVSDNFGYIIREVLKKNGIKNVRIISNKIEIKNDGLIPKFVLSNKECGNCGHCKSETLSKFNNKNRISVYIGDGLSDLCPSKKADIVFAKDELKNRLKKENIEFIPYSNMNHVYKYFTRSLI